ncbi:putative transcription factor C3H family [Helianthus anomalus]
MRPLSFPTCQHIPPFKKLAMEISGKRLHPHLHLISSYYMRTGMCKYGSTCKFNHPLRRKHQLYFQLFI